ncbi:MAG: cytochrome-c peroxidase [Myxococcota bacterium]
MAIADRLDLALISDPDGDRLLFFDLAHLSWRSSFPLNPGDQPGRWVVHNNFATVLLRGAGQAITFALGDLSQFTRRNVCPMPRGIAYDRSQHRLLVSCAHGEVMTLSDGPSGDARLWTRLDSDLRDVVVTPTSVLVSRFRSAEILVLDSHRGTVTDRFPISTTAEVAWQMIPAEDGALIVHQTTRPLTLKTTAGGYLDNSYCTLLPPVGGGVQRVKDDQPSDAVNFDVVTLPVSIALSHQSGEIAVVSAGGNGVRRISAGALGFPSSAPAQPVGGPPTAVAVAFDKDDRLITQTRLPGGIDVDGHSIAFPGTEPYDLGHALFHSDAGSGFACASCHPEGGDDGHVWNFENFGPRRTQFLAGGLAGTEPFHWSGDMADFSTIAHEVFTTRMGGPELNSAQQAAMLDWLDSIPAPPPGQAANPTLATRGKQVFVAHCSSCHGGTRLGRDLKRSVDVGTGESLQVPGLIGIGLRAPYLHNGCAATLTDRFGECGGGVAHGGIGVGVDASALVEYLSTL